MPTITVNDRLSEAVLDAAEGDTIELAGRPEPYRQRLVLPRGITIRGVPGPNGEPAVISGENATTHPAFALTYPPIEENGLITIWRTVASGDVMPIGITLENLTISGANPNNTYTGADGIAKHWGGYGSGIYALRYDGLTLRNCLIHDNSNGVLSGDSQPTSNYRQEGCRVWGNGLVGVDQCHGTYVQAVGAVYVGNWYGKGRSGSWGGSLKDRSSNALVEGNTVWSNGRCVDLSAFYGDSAAARLAADEGATIRNNFLIDDGSALDTIFHEGGRAPGTVTRIENNTIVYRVDQSALYYVRPWRSENDPSAILRISGNLVDVQSNVVGGRVPDVHVVDGAAKHEFGPNWIRPNVMLDHYGDPPVYTGLEKLIVSQTAPGFRDEANGDYSLSAGSPAAGFGADATTPLPPPPPPPPPPPVKEWKEIGRNVIAPPAATAILTPGLRKTTTTTTIEVFEQER